MVKTSNATKQKWNAEHYTQIKISVKPDIAAAFKSACGAAGASIASTLSSFMLEYIGEPAQDGTAIRKRNAESSTSDYRTMQKRRNAVKRIIQELESIKAAEEQFLDNAPENLRSAPVYGDAEVHISLLEDAICILGDTH